MSKLMLSMTAVAAIALGGHALAQSQTPSQPPPSSDQESPGNAPIDGQSAAPAAPTNLAVGLPVKDKTGATIGEIADLKPDASGNQVATVKMGADRFTLAAASLDVENGSAVVNASLQEIRAMIKKSRS
jgi:hypothetical protein